MLNRRRALTLIPAGGLLLTGALREKASAASRTPFAFDTLTHCKSSVDFAKAFAAGMTGSIIDLEAFPRAEPTALAELGEWAKAAAAPEVSFRIIRQAADFRAAKDAGKYAVVLASQDAAILETAGDAEDLRFATLAAYHELGLRDLQLTYNDRNKIGGGYWEDTQVPLSLYGRRLVAEMNRLGVIVDVSHSCQLTTLEAIKRSDKPVAVTHAGCRALFDNARNKSDEVIRALAAKGGYFGVYNMTLWMTAKPASSVATICDHIDHVVQVGGIDLAGFGSDHPPLGEPQSDAEYWVKSMTEWGAMNRALGRDVGGPPNGHTYAADLNGPDRLMRIADELSRRRYRQGDIDKILGLNFIRFFQSVCG